MTSDLLVKSKSWGHRSKFMFAQGKILPKWSVWL